MNQSGLAFRRERRIREDRRIGRRQAVAALAVSHILQDYRFTRFGEWKIGIKDPQCLLCVL